MIAYQAEQTLGNFKRFIFVYEKWTVIEISLTDVSRHPHKQPFAMLWIWIVLLFPINPRCCDGIEMPHKNNC